MAVQRSIGRRPLRRLDHEDVDRRTSWFEAQPELVLNGGNQRSAPRQIGCVVECELHIDIKGAGEAGRIYDRASGAEREYASDIGQQNAQSGVGRSM